MKEQGTSPISLTENAYSGFEYLVHLGLNNLTRDKKYSFCSKAL